MKIEIMDTTLRDGEQTSGVAFSPEEKLNIAHLLLEELKVDRIEIASARVSEGEFEGATKILNWAKTHGFIEKVEILGFIDGTASLDWINKVGGKVVNLLSKGSLNHVTGQLRKTPEQHLSDVKKAIAYARSLGIKCNLYLEDWSNGMKNSPDYVFFLVDALQHEPLERIMLPDTLGILNHEQTFDFCKAMIDRYPKLHFDFHAHNDYDLATANVYSAVKAGIRGIHTTINGLGERAGNVPLSSIIPILRDHLNIKLSLVEEKINRVSRLVETFSGIRIPSNKPVIGESVFTQTCGVHADGDNKNNLYYNDLLPERFGRVRKYALGKTAGKANILKNLEELGMEIDAELMRKVTDKVIELGDKKETITTEDLPYIVSDVMRSEVYADAIKIVNYSTTLTAGLRPVATVCIDIEGETYEATAVGDGQYNAFMNALTNIYAKLDKNLPELIDYVVSIPPGGQTDALVSTVITWRGLKEFKTRGLAPDQTVAAIKATVKMLNLIETFPKE